MLDLQTIYVNHLRPGLFAGCTSDSGLQWIAARWDFLVGQ